MALIRLDHSGKDETKGQRGGSAKSGDVDAIWRMKKEAETVFSLECEAARLHIPVGQKQIVIHRETEPRLHHRVEPTGGAGLGKARVDDLIAWLDGHNHPDGMTVRDAADALRDGGHKATQSIIAQAVKQRKERVAGWDFE